MKNLKYLSILFLSMLVVTACEENDHEFGPIVTPTNLGVNAVIIGLDADNPYGDGDGNVTFTATADDALAYQFDFGDGKSATVSSWVYTHTYTKSGVHPYTVIISAVGTAGVLSSTTVDVEVFFSFIDEEAETFLAGGLDVGDTKTWVWASDIPLHVGLGPVTDDYGNGEFAFEAWWNTIGPNDAEKSCMYTNEFVFTQTADGMTFEQTVGPAFVPGAYASIIGLAGDVCHDESEISTMFGVKNVSFLPSTSKAALEGSYGEDAAGDPIPYRGTSFDISDGGFMGWYVGDVVYDIISITANTMHVRCIQEGGGFAWYARYKSE